MSRLESVRDYAGEPAGEQAETFRAAVLPVPYDGTSTWGKGADRGPDALFEALENMELHDIETGAEVHREGIAILESVPVEVNGQILSPEQVRDAVHARVEEILNLGTLPVLVGGEHSVSIGAIQACARAEEGMAVLHIDAHSDLRSEFHGKKERFYRKTIFK